MNLVHLIYCSAATDPNMSAAQLESLLRKSRQNNARVGITGVLLFHEGTFFQVLEGDLDAVERVFETIQRDDRHTKVQKLIVEPIEERDFGDWTMGYPTFSTRDLQEIDGLNDFFADGNSFLQLGEGRAKKLLAAFRSGKWHTQVTAQSYCASLNHHDTTVTTKRARRIASFFDPVADAMSLSLERITSICSVLTDCCCVWRRCPASTNRWIRLLRTPCQAYLVDANIATPIRDTL